LKKFQIDGATAVTMDNIRSIFAEHSSNHNQERQEKLQDILRHITNVYTHPTSVERSLSEFGGEVHIWPGKKGFHRVRLIPNSQMIVLLQFGIDGLMAIHI